MKPDNTISTLVYGDEINYVLFKVALDAAQEGLNTWFITTKPFEKMPENLGNPSKQILQLITFIYLKQYANLIEHLNSTYKWKTTPHIIIIHNLNNYCTFTNGQFDRRELGLLYATLLDNASYISRSKQCKACILINYMNSESDRITMDEFQVYYDMYFDYFLLKSNYSTNEDLLDVVEHGFFLK